MTEQELRGKIYEEGSRQEKMEKLERFRYLNPYAKPGQIVFAGSSLLDLNAGITDENDNLRAEYTIEGMHMYANGYRRVLSALLPVLESLEMERSNRIG